jgi:hypothetical protein
MSKTNFSVIGIDNGVSVKVGDGFNQNFETCIRLDDGLLTITLHYGGLDEPLLEVEPAKLAFANREASQLILESLEHEWGIEADEGGGSRV